MNNDHEQPAVVINASHVRSVGIEALVDGALRADQGDRVIEILERTTSIDAGRTGLTICLLAEVCYFIGYAQRAIDLYYEFFEKDDYASISKARLVKSRANFADLLLLFRKSVEARRNIAVSLREIKRANSVDSPLRFYVQIMAQKICASTGRQPQADLFLRAAAVTSDSVRELPQNEAWHLRIEIACLPGWPRSTAIKRLRHWARSLAETDVGTSAESSQFTNFLQVANLPREIAENKRFTEFEAARALYGPFHAVVLARFRLLLQAFDGSGNEPDEIARLKLKSFYWTTKRLIPEISRWNGSDHAKCGIVCWLAGEYGRVADLLYRSAYAETKDLRGILPQITEKHRLFVIMLCSLRSSDCFLTH